MLSASFSTQVACRSIGGRREAKAEGESELDHRCNVELHSVFRRQQIALARFSAAISASPTFLL
jgi:hypothetical protein